MLANIEKNAYLYIVSLLVFFSFNIIYFSAALTDATIEETIDINQGVEQDGTSPVNTEEYHPEVTVVLRIPDNDLIFSNTPVDVYARVIDRYGEVNNATLFYSVDDTRWNNVTMDLINGLSSNGTFKATISIQEPSGTVRYKLYFIDNLGYSVTISDEAAFQYNVTSRKNTANLSLYSTADEYFPRGVFSDEYVPIEVIVDPDAGVVGAILNYSIGSFNHTVPNAL